MKKTVYGVGINDADYSTQLFEECGQVNGKRKIKMVWKCPFYRKWESLLRRCYAEDYQNKRPTYRGCTVCEEWLRFSNFKAWMEQQDWEDKQLDKDLLIKGNKLYSPETCCFVSREVNLFLVDTQKKDSSLPTGVVNARDGKFRAQCWHLFEGKYKQHLGYYSTVEEAEAAWRNCKRDQAKLLAEKQADPRVKEALICRYDGDLC